MRSTLLFILVILLQNQAQAWGERGHHIVGETSAQLVKELMSPLERTSVGDFYQSRALAFGHMNNLPDISWKAQTNEVVSSLNPATHFFDVDIYWEKPNLQDLDKVPASFEDFKKQHDGTDVVKSGTAPWRIGQLYAMAKQLGVCLKTVENQTGEKFKTLIFPMNGAEIIKDVKCPASPNAEAVSLAYVSVLGIMGHFVADLGQPYHATKDYDGWDTEQGGLHGYFEHDVVQELPADLQAKVLQKAKSILSKLNRNEDPFRMALQLAGDSYAQVPKVRDLDRRVSLQGKSSGKVKATRLPPNASKVRKAFQQIIIDRLALSSAHMALLLYENWKAAGSPVLKDRSRIAAPYPLDVAFIYPTYLPPLSR